MKKAVQFVKRRFAVSLAVMMCLSSLPTGIYADELSTEISAGEDAGMSEVNPAQEEVSVSDDSLTETTVPDSDAQQDNILPDITDSDDNSDVAEDGITEVETESTEEADTVDAIISNGISYSLEEDGTLTITGTGSMECMADLFSYTEKNQIANVIIGDGITEIPERAFDCCRALRSITMPDTVTTIGECAFWGCSSLIQVSIPGAVTEIEPFTFFDCSSLTSVTIPDGVSTIEDSAFMNCSSLTEILIPNSVAEIGDYAFADCISLTSVTIPDSVIEIGEYVFEECTALETANLPDEMTEIPGGMFNSCSSLTNIELPENVTEIGWGAFGGCTSLKGITFPESLMVIGHYAFEDCESLTDVVFPESLTEIGMRAFSYCSSLTSIAFPESLTELGYWSFADCTSLTDITFPDSMTEIGYAAFLGCTALTDLTIPDTVTAITYFAFACCTSLNNVSIPDTVTEIGEGAFKECTDLTSISIPSSVTSLGNGAFKECTNLTSISIPSSVTSLGNCAFEGCTALSDVNIPANTSLNEIHAGAFKDCTSLTSFTLPASVTSYEASFQGCTSLSDFSIASDNTNYTYRNGVVYTLPDLSTLVEYMGSGSDSVDIPAYVTDIAYCAFLNCSNLTAIGFRNKLESVDEWAFVGVYNVQDVYYTGSESDEKPFYSTEYYTYNESTGEWEPEYGFYRATWHYNSILPSYGSAECAEHTWDEGTVLKEKTDTEDGYVLYTCTVCGAQKEEILSTKAEITLQPVDTTVVAGEKFIFNVEATGTELTYLWQYSKDGGENWIDTTRTRDNFSTTATTAMNGRMFRCVVTDGNDNTVISDAATLTVKPAIDITSQTDAQTVKVGELYRFRVAAVSNTGSKLTYLWQYSKTLKGWTDTTRTVNNYGTYATVGVDGKYFRCKITDEAGNVVYSTPAMVRVLSDITITEQPTDTTVASGKRFYFTVTATGSSLTYLWQYSTDGGKTWIDTTRARNNYTTYAKKGMNGRMFRCVITDSSNNSVISEAGTLTVQ